VPVLLPTTTPLEATAIDHLLRQTSRTFALAIPLLEPSLARQVGIAYLLLRLADELEDAPLWGRDRRSRALASFVTWLDEVETSVSTEWKDLVNENPPTAHARAMAPNAARAIVEHTKRTAIGMAEFVARQDERGGLALADLNDLRRYAYVVAGIVGELLTDLFALADAGVATARAQLDADAAAFGEGLQLVNILKDAPSDAREGRSYLPANISRAEVMDLAREDLIRAERYVRMLADARAPRGMIAFCELPVRLAVATLDRLTEGAPKLTRDEVFQIYASVIGRT
jgi:farnesyl-diphosphate farnesyltransferase